MDYPICRNKTQLVKEIASIIIITDFIINFFLCQVKLRVLLGIIVTGSGKTRLLEQTKICVINVPNNRAEHCLHNDMLSVHIPSFIPESCTLETRSRKM